MVKKDLLAGLHGPVVLVQSYYTVQMQKGEKTANHNSLLQYDHNKMSGPHISTIFNSLLQGCINIKDLTACREVHSLIINHGFESDVFLGSSLIRMFSLYGTLVEAKLVFSKLVHPDVFTWSAIILAHAKHGQGEQAIKLYHEMRQRTMKPDGYVFVAVLQACASVLSLAEGRLTHSHIIESGFELDLFVGNALINMYGKYSSLEDAWIVFGKVPHRDVVTWSAMISGYSQHGDGEVALELFQQMQAEGKKPDKVTFVSVLKTCSSIAALDQGRLIHAQIIERSFELDEIVGSTLMDMYAKCRELQDAKSVFGALPKRNLVMWSAMIAGYTLNSEYRLALQFYMDMQQEGLKPNEVIFLCLLSACSHMGLLDEGCKLFNSMIVDYGLSPTIEHANCIVDLLGRSGCLKEAEKILKLIPYDSNIVGWTSLLSNCKVHGNVELGRRCFDLLVTIDPRDASAYVLMSSIYEAVEMWEAASGIKKMKETAKAWKKPGKAYIQVDDTVHQFVVSDTDRIKICDVCERLKSITAQTRAEGHVPSLDLGLETIADGDNEVAFL